MVISKYRSIQENFRIWFQSKYLGIKPDEVRYREWLDTVYNPRATKITEILFGFKYIVSVDYKKWFEMNPKMWEPVEDAKQYVGIDKGLIRWERGNWNGDVFEVNELFGGDYLFVGTNSEEDAVMITLKFA